MRLLDRQQPPLPLSRALLAGVATTVTIAALLGMSTLTSMPWLMAPFGASCVLLYTAPESPLSQPANLIGGHVVAALVGLLFASTLGNSSASIALATGVAVATMRWLRVTHPPAGANPIVVIEGTASGSFLLFPVLSGAMVLVLFALLLNRWDIRHTSCATGSKSVFNLSFFSRFTPKASTKASSQQGAKHDD